MLHGDIHGSAPHRTRFGTRTTPTLVCEIYHMLLFLSRSVKFKRQQQHDISTTCVQRILTPCPNRPAAAGGL